MKIIAHRGNLNGSLKEFENHPNYLLTALKKGYDVEFDLVYYHKKLFLGHDFPQYEFDPYQFIKFKDRLWVHCKTSSTLDYFSNDKFLNKFNFFFHDNDLATITSKGYIWTHTNCTVIKNSIKVIKHKIENPELYKDLFGICTDYPVFVNTINTSSNFQIISNFPKNF